ncbi:MAG: magnesium transporter MgtE N-terminal domain-containing protein [Ornithinimicrobium sp.]|uniref:magnesium transporter MgtE N-terminal domain-containing protein n=1 Tax=Ornithinimicrobium sp. TaxID=1977084 RepID=UPI0017B3A2BB|nr:magnesium transporter [Actinomycetota bacterium]
MSTSRVFVARLNGLSVFDPLGDEVGRVRDIVIGTARRATQPSPPVFGLVVEIPGRRRVFVPMTRVTSVDTGQIITTGLVNMRRFEQRRGETLALAELLDRRITVGNDKDDDNPSVPATVVDLALDLQRNGEWWVTKAFCRKGGAPERRRGLRLGRRSGETVLVDIDQVSGLFLTGPVQAADALLEAYEGLKPVDLAEAMHDLSAKRRKEVADALGDDRLADVLEELPEDDRVEVVSTLDIERAADVLEVMQPDDATDLISELPDALAELLLQRMEPDDAAPIRRLLTYEEDTAGGMMTTDPIILGPDASIAEALAVVRREEVSPALASLVFVARPPHETPTGKYLGAVHIQRLLREPPHEAIGGIVDRAIDSVGAQTSLAVMTRQLAAYNLVALPITDAQGRLLGAVSVDDVLDHLLPEDWRERDRTGEAADV